MPVIRPDEGRTVDLAGYRPTFKVVAPDSDGHLSMWEETVPPGWPAFLHRHLRQVEIFYVIDGELEFTVGKDVNAALAGSTVIVPMGAVHAYANNTDLPVRLLTIVAPGGFERLFEELEADATARGGFDSDAFLAIYRKHGNEPA